MPVLDFTLQTDSGDVLTLSSLRGKHVVLYFYPKDDTSGCTTESCEFRDRFPRFASSDAVILGISPDDVASHQKFKAKYNLPFTLLVDESHALAEQLGIWVEKQFMGNRYMGVARTTYIIGPDGAVQYVFERVNPAGHADEVMAFLQGGVDAALAARAAFDAAAAASKEQTIAKDAKDVPKRPLKQAAKKAGKKTARKTVKKAVRKAVKKSVKKAARKAPRKLARKTFTKPTRKPARKAARKPAAKK